MSNCANEPTTPSQYFSVLKPTAFMAAITAILLISSCADKFDNIAAHLDHVAKSVEEFGSISISSPLLVRVRPDSQPFAFGLHRSPEQYYQDARNDVHGASASYLIESTDTQAGMVVTLDYNKYLQSQYQLAGLNADLARYKTLQGLQSATAAARALAVVTSQTATTQAIPTSQFWSTVADAYDAMNRGLTTGPSRPEFPDLPEVASQPTVLPASRPSQRYLPTTTANAFQALVSGVAVTQPSRAALVTAAGDHITQQLLNFLSDPTEAAQFKGKRLYFAVMMVAVQPGDRTYRGYRADVSVRVALGRVIRPEERYGETRARAATGGAGAGGELPFAEESRAAPLVAAVSPMTEVQSLDLRASIRLQQAYALRLAAMLSGMGGNVQAEVFRDWVRRAERDVATRTNLNAVTAYSIAGGLFGYQVTPRLEALANAADNKAKPDLIMQPMTFPVLAIIGVDEFDLNAYGIDAIRFQQTSRWLPTGNPTADALPLGRFFDRLGKPRLSEIEMMQRMRRLADAAHELETTEADRYLSTSPSDPKWISRMESYSKERIQTYGYVAGLQSANIQTLESVDRASLPTIYGIGVDTEVLSVKIRNVLAAYQIADAKIDIVDSNVIIRLVHKPNAEISQQLPELMEKLDELVNSELKVRLEHATSQSERQRVVILPPDSVE